MTSDKKSAVFDKRRQSRRDEIVDAAIKCFAEQGYEKTTLHDIAARLGLTHAALYYYYKSKEVLLVQSAQIVMQMLTSNLHAAAQRDTSSPRVALKNVIVAQILYQFETREVTPFIDSVLFGAHSRRNIISETHLEDLRQSQRTIAGIYKAIIQRGGEAGDFTIANINEVVFAIIGMVSHTVYWYTPHDDADLNNFAAQQAELCLKLCA